MTDFPGRCYYCGEPLTDNEYDVESGGYFSSHGRCYGETSTGAFLVTSTLDGEPWCGPKRYNVFKRAQAEAEHLASWNSPRGMFYVHRVGEPAPLFAIRGHLRRPTQAGA
jgi:hypothetical protein